MTRQYMSSESTPERLIPAKVSGFSLLEVMIALIVLSIGLLGIAGLQTFSLQFNHQSYERTQATVLISEIFDRIMANPTAARAGSYDNVVLASTAADYSSFGACATTGCANTADLATYDIFSWKTAIDNSKISQGQGSVIRANPGDANSFVFDITISWIENNIPATQTMRVRTL